MRVLSLWLVPALLLGPASMAARPSAPDAPTTHVVEMVLRDGAYRFVPETVSAKPGDRVTFVMRSGGPHNVAFDAAKVPDSAEPKLRAGMPDQMSPLAGPLLMQEGARYTISLDGVPAGSYPFFCMPHMAMGMTGVLTVQ